jgi:3-phenylpropionate/trans-cinnamate dioxygenase ferredoxin subunit
MNKMAIIKLASIADLEPNTMKVVNANGTPILLVNLDGTFYAIGNACTHMGCPLSRGTLKSNTVQCACHGSVFNVKTGEVARGPAKKPEPKYELRISGDQILVNM